MTQAYDEKQISMHYLSVFPLSSKTTSSPKLQKLPEPRKQALLLTRLSAIATTTSRCLTINARSDELPRTLALDNKRDLSIRSLVGLGNVLFQVL